MVAGALIATEGEHLGEMLKLTADYKHHPEAVQTRLRDETVILHLQSGLYFGLDAVGTLVWTCLEAGDTPANIIAKVNETFTDKPETVARDLTDFLTQLLHNDLIVAC